MNLRPSVRERARGGAGTARGILLTERQRKNFTRSLARSFSNPPRGSFHSARARRRYARPRVRARPRDPLALLPPRRSQESVAACREKETRGAAAPRGLQRSREDALMRSRVCWRRTGNTPSEGRSMGSLRAGERPLRPIPCAVFEAQPWLVPPLACRTHTRPPLRPHHRVVVKLEGDVLDALGIPRRSEVVSLSDLCVFLSCSQFDNGFTTINSFYIP